jgi:hypothetical protein
MSGRIRWPSSCFIPLKWTLDISLWLFLLDVLFTLLPAHEPQRQFADSPFGPKTIACQFF